MNRKMLSLVVAEWIQDPSRLKIKNLITLLYRSTDAAPGLRSFHLETLSCNPFMSKEMKNSILER